MMFLTMLIQWSNEQAPVEGSVTWVMLARICELKRNQIGRNVKALNLAWNLL